MFQLSVDMRNAALDAYEIVLDTEPTFAVMTGVQPVDCAATETGTRLVAVTMPSDWMTPAAGGQKMMLGTWQSPSITSDGFAGYYRIYAKTGSNRCKAQGPVAQAWLPSTLVIAGQQLAFEDNIYVVTTNGATDALDGPVGTGTGITNGTAILDYLTDTRGMILVDDTNFLVGQPLTVRSYTWTAGNR